MIDYEIIQYGDGTRSYSGISHVYVGSPYQRGHGIGSFLGGLFRRVLPFLKSGLKTVGKEALRSGVNIATDVLDHKIPTEESFKTRVRESGKNLKRKAQEKIESLMSGFGYIPSQFALTDGMSNTQPNSKKRVVKKKRRLVKSKVKNKSKVNKKKTNIKKKNNNKNKKLRTVADIFNKNF